MTRFTTTPKGCDMTGWEPPPDLYDRATPGPYTPPVDPVPVQPAKPRWGALITAGVLVGLFIVGLAVSASRDDTVVQIPNSVVTRSTAPTSPPAARPVEKAPPAGAKAEAKYLGIVRATYPIANGVSDEALVGIARSTCGLLGSGGDREDVLIILAGEPGSPTRDLLVFAARAGVSVFCPEFDAVMRGR